MMTSVLRRKVASNQSWFWFGSVFRFFLYGVTVAWIGSVAGCYNGNNAGDAEEPEQHFPPHWPETISAATDRLAALAGGSAEKAPHVLVSLEQEWVDLFRWLPELAADSEISKGDFDRIDEVASKYGIQMEKMLEKGNTLKQMTSEPGLAEALAWMQEISLKESSRIQNLEQQ